MWEEECGIWDELGEMCDKRRRMRGDGQRRGHTDCAN